VKGESVIATEVLATYAADAAAEVAGVSELVESALHRHKGVRVTADDGRITVELHLAVAWGSSIPDVGRAVQGQVAEYLARMAGVRPAAVNVVVDEVR
jgi:uncharacterized alkaline shock family protein YloU